MSHMHNPAPDFARYSIEQLEDVLAHINRDKYPERYADAKAMLAIKVQQQPAVPTDSELNDAEPLPVPNWSKLRLITRIVMVVFLLPLFFSIPGLFSEFIAANRWQETISSVIWLLDFIFIVAWCLCLVTDSNFSRQFGQNWEGKASVVAMPFVFFLFNWQFIGETIPLFLHKLSPQQHASYEMDYHKSKSRKGCQYPVELAGTTELAASSLCVTAQQRNRLPETGKLKIQGSRSQFGLTIEDFTFQR